MSTATQNTAGTNIPSEEGSAETKSYPSIQMWKRKMTVHWENILKFPPTSDHLDEWTFLLNSQIRLPEYLSRITVDDLLIIVKQASSSKGKSDDDSLKHAGSGEPALKSFWKEHMDFSPTKLQLALLQEKIDKDLGIDRLIAQMKLNDLVNIIVEIASRITKSNSSATAPKE